MHDRLEIWPGCENQHRLADKDDAYDGDVFCYHYCR